MPGHDDELVWSSDGGDRRRGRGGSGGDAPGPRGGGRGRGRDAARGSAGSRRPATGSGRAKVRREVAGRRGKGVTTVSELPLDDDAIRALAGRLKKRCGVGGSAKDGVIELQGDHRETVMAVLEAEGIDAVLAGG
jgi:translation initiation factor 1